MYSAAMHGVPRRRLALAVALLLVARLSAQSEPDFSGRWRLIDPRTAPPAFAHTLIVQPTIRSIDVRGDPIRPFTWSLLVERQAAARVQSEEYVLGVQGGSVAGVSALAPGRGGTLPGSSGETRFYARFQGSEFVIDTAQCPGDCLDRSHWTSSLETWRLDEAHHLLVTLTESAPGRPPVTMTAVYQRE